MDYRSFANLTGVESIWVIILVITVVWNAFRFFKNNRHYKAVKNQPLSPISTSHAGYIKVSGQVVNENAYATPFFKEPCCYWEAKVVGHWSETDHSSDSNTDTEDHSEVIYNKALDIDYLEVNDGTESILYPINLKIRDMITDSQTAHAFGSGSIYSNVIGKSLYKYDYLEVVEKRVLNGESATAVGQLAFQYDGDSRVLYVDKAKNRSLPTFLSIQSPAALHESLRSGVVNRFVYIGVGLFFIFDTFYFDSRVSSNIIEFIMIVLALILKAFSYFLNLF